jgi:Tfp pilus assembly protein PilF
VAAEASDSQLAPARRSGRRRLLAAAAPLALALFVAGVHLPALEGGFVYDDRILILEQPPPRGLRDLARVFAERHWFNLPYYRPVSRLTMVWQKGLHGNEPAPYHAFNLALGVAVSLLCYALLRQPAFGIGRVPALLAAALFGAHPVSADCIYPISSGRETLIPVALSLASLVAWLRAGAAWRAAALVALALALLAKEQCVVLPLCLVWADLLGVSQDPPGRSARRWLFRCLPLLAILAGYAALRALVFGGGGGLRLAVALQPLGPLLSVLYALQTLFAPFAELVYEPRLEIWLSPPRLGAALLAALALAVAAARGPKQSRRAALFFAGVALISLAPTANLLVQEAPFAERYGLLALAGVAGAAASAVAARVGSKAAARAAVAAALLVALGAAALSRGRAPAWADDLAFHSQWLRTDPLAAQPQVGLGQWYAERGSLAESRAHYEAAIALRPDYAVAHASLGAVLLAHGEDAEAVRTLERAAALDPTAATTWSNLGVALARLGRSAEARAAYGRALELEPGLSAARHNLGALKQARSARSDAKPGEGHRKQARSARSEAKPSEGRRARR